jgi:DNA-binding GntR family transcriptional regulator
MALAYTLHAGSGDPDGAATWQGHPTEAERIYRILKRAILAGELPPGVPLQEVRLATELGASRTPVREAFRRLEGDGLLTISPRRGAFVQQPTARDFFDVRQLRLILEPAAARLAASLVDEADVRDLQARLAAIAAERPSESDFAALDALDRSLHSTVAIATQNARMRQILQSLNDMMQILREKDMRLRHREMHASIGEVLTALAARDGDAAEAAMRRHVGAFSLPKSSPAPGSTGGVPA